MPSTITYLGRAEIRQRWRTYAGLAVLLGLIAGLSLFSFAGARRVQSSFTRFHDAGDPSTMSIASSTIYDAKVDRAIASLPAVTKSRTWVGLSLYEMKDGRPILDDLWEGTGTFDGQYFDQDRFTPTTGRMARPERVDEIVVNELGAARFGVEVGQRMDLGTYNMESFSQPDFATDPPGPIRRTAVTVVGIGLFADEVLQDQADRTARLLVTPAFTQQSRNEATYWVQHLVLKRGDRDIDATQARIGRILPLEQTDIHVASVDEFHAVQSIRPLAVALALFGTIAGLAGIVLVSQGLARAIRAQGEERSAQHALGMSPSDLTQLSLVGPAVAILAGTALAGAAAILASPAMPIGPVRRVEVDRGIDVDTTVIGLGALAFVVVLLATCVVIIRRGLPRHAAGHRVIDRPSRIALAAARGGLPPPAVTGLRLAFAGTGGGAAPARSVMIGAAVAISALVAAITFGASLNHLVDDPRLYGWDWDATILSGGGYDNLDVDAANEILAADPNVEDWAGANFGADTIDGRSTPLLGMGPGAKVGPPILRGRGLEGPNEIVLGPATADTLKVTVGDWVRLGHTPERVIVVGMTTLPTLGRTHVEHTSLGIGAIVPRDLLPNIDIALTGEQSKNLGPNAIFVRYRPGTDETAQTEQLRRTTLPLMGFAGLDVLETQRPAEIVHSNSLGAAPTLLASGLAVGALLSLGLALASTVRRQRRELALLKALGTTPRETGASVAWQATATIGVGLAAGIPLGLLAGQQLWSRFASQLDVVNEVTLPATTVLLIALAALAVANVVAAIPARAARRTDTTVLLRAE